MKTIFRLMPWLMFPEAEGGHRGGVFISPDPDPAGASGGGGGGGGQPPAPAAPPAPQPPAPAQPQGELRPIVPPSPQPGQPGAAQPPAQMPQPGQPPTPAQPPPGTPQGGGDNAPVTMAMLRSTMSEFMQQLTGLRPGGQPPQPGQPPAPAVPAPPAPAPQPAPQPPAPAQPSAPPPAPAPQPSTMEYQALQNSVTEMKKQLDASNARIAEIDQERQRAVQTASFAQIKETVRTSFANHSTYRLAPDAATQATELLMARGALRNDQNGNTFVVLPNAQTGREEIWDMSTGLTKFLESREGQFYRAAVPGGSGASGSHGGYPPVSIPNTGQGGAGGLNGGFQSAVEEQQRMQNGQMPSR